MSKIIKLEVLIAWPPTSKCQEAIRNLEELVRRHPDELRLLVFKRGIDTCSADASIVMKCLIQKSSPVPTCVVNGVFFGSRVVPKLEELEARVQDILVSTDEYQKTGS
jgi:hypothetical protein